MSTISRTVVNEKIVKWLFMIPTIFILKDSFDLKLRSLYMSSLTVFQNLKLDIFLLFLLHRWYFEGNTFPDFRPCTRISTHSPNFLTSINFLYSLYYWYHFPISPFTTLNPHVSSLDMNFLLVISIMRLKFWHLKLEQNLIQLKT